MTVSTRQLVLNLNFLKLQFTVAIQNLDGTFGDWTIKFVHYSDIRHYLSDISADHLKTEPKLGKVFRCPKHSFYGWVLVDIQIYKSFFGKMDHLCNAAETSPSSKFG